MAADPYDTLGVKKDVSQEDLQKAYRKLAKKLHPDLNPGNKRAEEQFKEVAAAYDIVGDAEKRARFDRGEIDSSGAERPRQQYYRDFAADEAGHPYASDAGFADFEGSDDILAEIFGRPGEGHFRVRGMDVRYRLALDFLVAINGVKQQLTLPDGSKLDVTIPPGTRQSQILRLRGKGQPGGGGGPAGDALIEIEVRPHPFFTRKDDDIHVDLPISLREAVLGAKVDVPTVAGA
ncbi:MAG: DnaJ C-terminal domain-containing protein, partial [Xanthobacteraceae bacterium]